mgnify:CR=1 FL=1
MTRTRLTIADSTRPTLISHQKFRGLLFRANHTRETAGSTPFAKGKVLLHQNADLLSSCGQSDIDGDGPDARRSRERGQIARDAGSTKVGRGAFSPWLVEQFNRNHDVDEIVAELLTVEGEIRDQPQSLFIPARLHSPLHQPLPWVREC